MKRSEHRILTTHVGSLSRPADLLASFRARAEGKAQPGHAATLAAAVASVVKRQRDTGIDIVNDGEFGKPMSQSYDYSPWWTYASARLDGFTPPEQLPRSEHRQSSVARSSWQASAIAATGSGSTNSIRIRPADSSAARRPGATPAGRSAPGRSPTKARRQPRPTSTI